MAEEHTEEHRTEDEHTNGHHLGRVAAIAAASGATAFAARKAFGRSGHGGDNSQSDRAKDGASLIGAAVSSGWEVAKDSLIPVVEDAAAKAGAFVAERAPEVVRDVVIPRFIAGFERGRGKRDGGSSD
jgi:hypothetical protein